MKILEYLRSKGFKPEKRGSVYQMVCPLKDRHIDYKPSFTIYEETDSFFCFGCQTGGKLKYLMQLFGDPIPKELIDITTEIFMHEIRTKKPRQERIINIITRLRRLRSWYPNQHRLNTRLLKVLGGIHGNTAPGGPSHKAQA